MLLAGPSMAGKSSLLRTLRGSEQRLTDAATERTIGLDIERVALPDPSGRAPRGIELLCYDAGGHDEYREMHGLFVTPQTLYVLVWNLAARPQEEVGEDAEAFAERTVQTLASWATLIQGCAPGSTVLLVGSDGMQQLTRDREIADEASARSLLWLLEAAVSLAHVLLWELALSLIHI